jgi:peptide/nickel transport system substrate-binding protein
LGIKANITLVDGAQYTERSRTLDFDMMPFARDLSLSPGNEQFLYWSSDNAELEGTRNMMGVKSDALDVMLDRIMTAKSLDELNAITRAMDRILTAGRFVIPIYHDGPSRIAHKSTLKRPENTPIYGDRIGYFPDVWWHQN